jgi:hypothetical protein
VTNQPTPPTVLSIAAAATGASNGNGNVGVGAVITFTVKFDQSVEVKGTPTLTLNDGGTATYLSGSGSSILLYTYTVLTVDQSVPDLQVTAYSNLTSTITGAHGNKSATFVSAPLNPVGTLQIDTAPPAAPSITSVTDDVPQGIGLLQNGAGTNDTDLTVKVSLIGTGAVAGDTMQLHNGIGTDTRSQLGSSFVITAADITAGFANVQTGTLLTIGTYNITARLIDQAGNISAASAAFTVTEDPSAVCFTRGTHLLTDSGEALVEALRLEDLMITADGKLSPVKWIGQRTINIAAHPRPETVAPIRIQRGAFADNIPHNDLLVSPDHAIFVEGKLICARQLINGTTICQEQGLTSVEYFHVELDAHAILLAEGLPTESYLDTGNRGFFANSDKPLVLHPDLSDEGNCPTREAASCAPFVWDETTVQPVWQRLAERAATLGQPALSPQTTTDSDLRLFVNGRSLRPISGENGRFIFMLPRGATEGHLLSRASSPTDLRPWLADNRSLGLFVEQIVLRDHANELQEIAIDDPALAEGWWAVEQEGIALRRWTKGRAVLPLYRMPGAAMLEIRVGGSRQYLVKAKDRAAA